MRIKEAAAIPVLVGALSLAAGVVMAPPASAGTQGCTGALGEPIAHPEYFCNGFTVRPAQPGPYDEHVKRGAICIVDLGVEKGLFGLNWAGFGWSAGRCAVSTIWGW